jgi:site-specific recombinase XerC
MYSNWACKALKRVLKHDMDLTSLRHIYITDMMKDRSSREMVGIARMMGHSRDTQRVYEWEGK